MIESINCTAKLLFFAVYLNLKTTLDDNPFCKIAGFSRLQNHLCVLCRRHYNFESPAIHTVRCYDDETPFDLLWIISIEEIKKPCSCIQGNNSNSLYIFDCEENCIWKMSLYGRMVAARWFCGVKRSNYLSVFSDGRLLLLKENLLCARLEIYGSDAVLIKSLPLRCDFRKSSEYISIDGRPIDEPCFIIIRHLKKDGQVARKFNPRTTSKTIRWPCLLLMDADDRWLFVTDPYNHNIVLLDLDSLRWFPIIQTIRQSFMFWDFSHD